MLTRLACGLVAAFALVCAAQAEEEKQTQAAPGIPEPVRLGDAELDEVTAGITVVLFTPGKGNVTINEPNRSILITGGSPSTFGFILTPNGKFIIIPGGQ
ncbi:MAG TPA: hypothetical protein VFK84_10925 [Burkholderiales bacterium]|nr:hypothetical protein [Burkholderiales bacterium]